MSIVVGILVSMFGRYRWALWAGWSAACLGAGILYLLNPNTTIVTWVWLNIPISIGAGMLFTSLGLAVQAACRPTDAGHAAAFYSFIRVFGQSIGVAIGGVIFQNQIKEKLLSYPLLAPLAVQYSKDATALVAIIKAMDDGLEKSQLKQAYADSLKTIWVVMCALCGLCMISTAFVKAYSLDQEHKTLQGLQEKRPSGGESGEEQ
jgi:MFS family permease